MSEEKNKTIIQLVQKGFTKKEIAKSLKISEKVISKIVKDNGLKLTKAYSHGNDHIYETLKRMFPYMLIEREHHVTSGLRIDVYIPQLKIGFEFDGEQHSTFNKFFHGTLDNFNKAKSLDWNKTYYCNTHGIELIRFKETPSDLVLIKYVTDRIQKNK